ncbi:MAG: hypothetical protein JNM99_02910 [Verrucomicrobiaceae bacterium]|nr:hypothetical protein [Verrucomicrobiaceae bacterium]
MRLALLLTCFAFTAFAQLPLELKPKQRIVLIGNTLFDRMRDYGQFEAMLQQRFAKEEVTVRNLAWSADEVALRPRPDGFGDLNEHLTEAKADVILAAFGFNESFKGIEAIPEFEALLKAFLIELKSHRYNGTSAPRIVLVSPTALEDLGAPLPPAKPTNERLAAYTESMKKVAAAEGVGFVDVFAATLEAFGKKATSGETRTINSIHLNEAGYTVFAEQLFNGLLHETPPTVNPNVRAMVDAKEEQWFYHYRPLNYYYIKGGRMEPYGVVNFPGELHKLAQMTEVRDQYIHELVNGEMNTKAANAFTERLTRAWGPQPGVREPSSRADPALFDDLNTEPLPTITGDRPINEWHTPADELAAFKIDPRFEVNCFASEEDFPDLFKKPIQIRWDTQGRLWVSTSVTYPQVYPGQAPQDQILILEDTNRDGKADKCSVWADKLQIPLSFEFGDGGVYCSEQPNLIFLKDTDGDGKADLKKVVLSGFGTEDSHHALHDFAWSPDGALIFRESIFHHSQVETPYGPVRARESSFFRFDTHTQRLQAFGSYMSTNPWGICFDDWGFHMGSHPVFAEAVHALNPAYPDQHVPAGAYFPAYSGTCGQEFLHNTHWGKEFHNHFARVRYKPTNEVELHEWVEKDSHFEEKKVGQIFQSSDLSFIPVDCKCGPDGALYICDWYNPVKGHMQYSLRDTRRDKTSGRIWRVTKRGAKLQEPVKIAGEPVEKLLELLKSDDLRTRYLVRGELRERDAKKVLPAIAAISAPPPNQLMELLWVASPSLPSVPRFPWQVVTSLADNELARARATAARTLRSSPNELQRGTLLSKAANDPSGLVRLEAAIAASYIGTPEALESALDLLKHPMDEYLTFALRTALDSHTLKPHWFNNAAFMQKHPELEKFLKDSEPKKAVFGQKKKKVEKPDPFDAQAGLQVVNVSTVPERMLFTNREFHVKAKAPVKLVFENPDVTAHNLVLVQPGAADEVGLAGNEMAKDASGMAKGFIPDNPKILHHTKLLNQGDSETLRFLAPERPGRYPYICTFPGHWLVMKGEMVVE